MRLRYKFMLVIVTILLLSTLTIGSSYSLWLSNSTQLGENTMNIGCFNLTFEDSDAINLTNSYPIPHSVGRNLHPYTFTITNICDYTASFNVNLELLSSTTLSESDIRVMLNNGGSKLYSEYAEANAILSDDGTTLSDTSTNTSRKITSGVLWPNKSRTYSLRLWIDEDASNSVMNKGLHAKVVTSSTPYVDKNPCIYDGELVQGAEYSDGTYTYKYKQEVTSYGWQNINEDGWGVKLSDTSATGEVNTKICTSINGKPIVSMASMFYNAKDLTKIDVSSFDTSNVVRMNNMFENAGYNSSSFEILGLNYLDTSNVTNMFSMFRFAGKNATTWNIGDLSSWNTSNVTIMQYLFSDAGYNSNSLKIDLSNWDTSNVTTMGYMFSNFGSNATTWSIGDLSSWDTSRVTYMGNMFGSAGRRAITFDLGDLSNWNTSNVTNMLSMFDYAGFSATTWNIGKKLNWDTSKVSVMQRMFASAGGGSNLTEFIVDLSSWDTSNVQVMDYMFDCTGYNAKTWDIGDLSNWNVKKVVTMSNMFHETGVNAVEYNLNLSNWDTSGTYDMSYMFSGAGYNASSINLNLSGWDTSNVTNMKYMFYETGYNSVDFTLSISNWDTSKVTNMSNMFEKSGYNATNFNNIGTLKVYATNMYEMFYNSPKAKVTLNIYSNPTSYDSAFASAATSSGSGITVNYSSTTTNIDDIIATKSSNSNVVKGVQLD